MNPIIRWAGSKRYLASTLVPLFPKNYLRYVEPFCGSASLFFIIEPELALLSDINEDLINALQMIKARPRMVSEISNFLPSSKEDYYLIRSVSPSSLPKIHRAARFMYLNRLCFNGLYRTNKNGQFNVPYSGAKTREFSDTERVLEAARILKNAEVRIMDFYECVEKARVGDFYYIDPPYASTAGQYFTEYHARPFASSDISRLEKCLEYLDSKGCKFMLSYASCDDIKNISDRWNCRIVQVRRNIAGFAGARRVAEEVVITNYR